MIGLLCICLWCCISWFCMKQKLIVVVDAFALILRFFFQVSNIFDSTGRIQYPLSTQCHRFILVRDFFSCPLSLYQFIPVSLRVHMTHFSLLSVELVERVCHTLPAFVWHGQSRPIVRECFKRKMKKFLMAYANVTCVWCEGHACTSWADTTDRSTCSALCKEIILCPYAGESSGVRLMWMCQPHRQQHHVPRAREWEITVTVTVGIAVVVIRAQHYFPIRLNFAPLAHAGFSVSLLNAYSIHSNRVHMQSVSLANHCRQPFHLPWFHVFWRCCWCCCYCSAECTIVKHIFPKIQFTFATVYPIGRNTIRYIGACWTQVFDFAARIRYWQKGTIRFSIGIILLSFVSRAQYTARLLIINTHVHRSIRWRFYYAYNSIDNLWWCDDDNDGDDDDDEFI